MGVDFKATCVTRAPIGNGICTLHITHLQQQCHNSKFVIFQEKRLKVLKCYNFLWEQRRHNCSPAASFVNCIMTLYLLKVHLQTFLSIPITEKCQILSCDTLVAKERYQFQLKFCTLRPIRSSVWGKVATDNRSGKESGFFGYLQSLAWLSICSSCRPRKI